jgi:hypothetical protein
MPMSDSVRTRLEPAAQPIDAELHAAAVLCMARIALDSQAMLFADAFDERLAAVERARDELSWLESVVDQEGDGCVREQLRALRQQTAGLPAPASWLEVLTAQLVLSTLGELQAQAAQAPGVRALRSVLRERGVAAADALADQLTSAEVQEEARDAERRWLNHALSLSGLSPMEPVLRATLKNVRLLKVARAA